MNPSLTHANFSCKWNDRLLSRYHEAHMRAIPYRYVIERAAMWRKTISKTTNRIPSTSPPPTENMDFPFKHISHIHCECTVQCTVFHSTMCNELEWDIIINRRSHMNGLLMRAWQVYADVYVYDVRARLCG